MASGSVAKEAKEMPSRGRRVLVLGSYAESLVNFRGPLLDALVKGGHEVIACAPQASDRVKKNLGELGVAYHAVSFARTEISPFRDLASCFNLYRLFRQLRPDVVLAYTVKPVLFGSFAAWAAGVPKIYSIITGVGYAFAEGGGGRRWLQRIVRTLYRISLRFNRRVFFQNPDDLALFRSLRLLSDEEQAIVVNGSGVDIQHFSPQPVPMTCSFLMVARLLRSKGVVEYVEAARQVKKDYPDVIFRLAGRFDDHPDSIDREQLDGWVHEGVVEYLGYVDDVRSVLCDCSVYVLPSYREGTPRTVLEAMAMGRPVITSDAPGCRETVVSGDSGFLVPVRDIEALVDAMQRFLISPDLVGFMGAAGRVRAEEIYDVHKVNAVMLEKMQLAVPLQGLRGRNR